MNIPVLADNFDYWDLRVLKNKVEIVSVDDETVNALNVSDAFSVGLRVVKNGSWAFVSSNKLDLNNLFKQALKISKIKGVKIGSLPKIFDSAKFKSSFKINPFNESIEKKISILKELNSEIKNYSKEISTAQTYIAYNKNDLEIVNSSGAQINGESLFTRYFTKGIAVKNGCLQQAFERNYVTGGLEVLYDEDLLKLASKVGERVIRLLHAKHAPPKRLPVVCDANMTGLFFHEAVGHACEADEVLMNASVLKGKVGEKVASDLITFSDYSGPKNSFGRVVFDDEGVKKKEAVLIDKGVLKGYLHSLHTASIMNVEPTGNGRAMSASNFPIPRMTTLKVKSGSFNESELFSGVKRGVLVKGFKGGEVNPTEGKFIFAASEAFMIENGEITTPLRDVTISGNIEKTMHCISGVSKKVELTDGGVCGKAGQHVPVSEVMPWTRIDEVLVGGRDS
ncbi:MAG: TldD/PmbA family protein [Nanoarchaeota archaeon]|nr:TldD/PmbA family protein [Nanoarchaeota archaeon]